MTNKEYFGGHSQPGTLGGGTGGASGGTGGAPQERYYTPRRRQRRGGGGGYSGGGDYAQAPQAQAGGGEWESAMQQFSSRPDFLVQLQDFLALSDYEGQSLLQRFPDLALYISQLSPEQIARLRQGYLAWASATGRLSTTQAARQNANPGMSLRVYGRRSGRSGLTG